MTTKVAKAWFKANPRCAVSGHWRWNELPQSSREVMSAPRLVEIRGNRAVFGAGQSEMNLAGVDAEVTDDGLMVRFGSVGWVSYEARPLTPA